MKTLYKYVRIWWLMSRNSFISVFYAKIPFVLFLTGKIVRFIFFLVFLFYLVKGANSIAGFNTYQIIFFFLTFNIVDILAQFLFREVYRFRSLVVTGNFDLVMVKPINALFRALMGGADIIDFVTVPPLIAATVYVAKMLNPTPPQVILYILLIVNALVIATAFHIAVLALGIITFEIDHMVMIYRDILNLGRLPVDIYREPLRSILMYFLPVGIMISLPAKSILGLVSPIAVSVSFLIAVASVLIAYRFWNYALKLYTSASS